jgi:hypothetical protein
MSKQAVIRIIAGLLVIAGLILSSFESIRPLIPWGNPIFTEEIPKKRPPRLDRRMMERFAGLEVDEIISTILEQRASNPVIAPPLGAPSRKDNLLASLPDAPLPFPDEATPADSNWLREFVATIQNNAGNTLSQEEIWQLNLAMSALKIEDSQILKDSRRDTSPPAESDTFAIRFTNKPVELKAPFCSGDFNGDGTIEFVSKGGTEAFHLDTSGRFVPIPWPAVTYPGNGLFPADYDNDGDLDLFVTRDNGLPNSMMRNRGDGNFDDVTTDVGLLSFDSTNLAVWLDFDQDGFLDLMVGSEELPLELYRQDKLATFEPVAWDLKLWIPRGTRFAEVADINNDQVPDFYLGIHGLQNRLYIGQRSSNSANWRFKNIFQDFNLGDSSLSVPGHFFDFNNNGHLDFLTVAEGRIKLLQNTGEGRLTQITEEVSLPETTATAFGSFDVDNDGYQDLLIGTDTLEFNHILWNREGTDFRDISVTSEGNFLDKPVQVMVNDLDVDGQADIIYTTSSGNVRWLQPTGPLGRWIHISLTGNPKNGTKITVISRDEDWILQRIPRTIRGDFSLTIGLGEASKVESLSVTLPDGTEPTEPLSFLEPDQRISFTIP